jgi:hypothetical protein
VNGRKYIRVLRLSRITGGFLASEALRSPREGDGANVTWFGDPFVEDPINETQHIDGLRGTLPPRIGASASACHGAGCARSTHDGYSRGGRLLTGKVGWNHHLSVAEPVVDNRSRVRHKRRRASHHGLTGNT